MTNTETDKMSFSQFSIPFDPTILNWNSKTLLNSRNNIISFKSVVTKLVFLRSNKNILVHLMCKFKNVQKIFWLIILRRVKSFAILLTYLLYSSSYVK